MKIPTFLLHVLTFVGYVQEIGDNMPELYMWVTYDDTGEYVTYFKEYVQIQYHDVPTDLIKVNEVKITNQTIISYVSCDCFYTKDGTSIILYTKEIPYIESICHVSYVLVNVYYKSTPDGFDIKIYLTTVRKGYVPVLFAKGPTYLFWS